MPILTEKSSHATPVCGNKKCGGGCDPHTSKPRDIEAMSIHATKAKTWKKGIMVSTVPNDDEGEVDEMQSPMSKKRSTPYFFHLEKQVSDRVECQE